MQITEVRISLVESIGAMKAVATITIDEEFVVHDIRVIDGNRGLFVAMPSKRTSDGQFRDVAHPISSATRQKIQQAVLSAFEQMRQEQAIIGEGA